MNEITINIVNKNKDKDLDKLKDWFKLILNKANPLVYGFLKSSGVYDKINSYMPKVIYILYNNPDGVEILKELNIYEEIKKTIEG